MRFKKNPYLEATLLEVVEKQLTHRDPPEVKETYDRLLSEGFSDEESRRLIGAALVNEVYTIMKERQPFNHARYVAALHKLPKLPWEE
ncbi:MAG: DUF1841 family protein [candidate division KSB1 bacterium]|nr:DUF1841 family protein [candidate division KSB1 bacterium]MDZ7303158.1 DUF1841 family protein [candidate division KSB1 bacterium]MDZ7310138.1 DUF1841 family protein [candidate division KSB1 bacterium]